MMMAQNYTHEFEKFSNEDFELQLYAPDTSAAAVVIYDIGKSCFKLTDDGFRLFFERKFKIKILSNAGLEWAQVSIPYYQERDRAEEITQLKGNTYNMENGEVRISKLDRKNIYIEKDKENWYKKKFAMPDVKVGSFFEVSYLVTSPYLFNLRNWEFQQRIPVIYSEYTTRMNPFYEYTYIFQGAGRFDEYKSYEDKYTSNYFNSMEYHDMVYFFVMKNIPAFKDEAFITSIDDYIIKLDFQLSSIHHPSGYSEEIMTTWPKLSKELLEHEKFGKYLKKCRQKGKDITDTMPLGTKSAMDKAKQIDRMVKSDFRWNHTNAKFASGSVKDLLVKKSGNSADLNLFLAGLLNAAGLEAWPMILSTRHHGKIMIDYPFQHFFNYVMVLARLDDALFLLDATEPLSNFTEIPAQCLNVKGLVIREDKTEWVNLKNSSVSAMNYNFDLMLNSAKDSIFQKCLLTSTGYVAMDFRNEYSDSYKELKDELLGANAGLNDTITVTCAKEIEKPFKMAYTKNIQVETVEDKIIISPFGNNVITENPLKMPVRNYPVDFTYRQSRSYNSVLTIPAGYKLLSIPNNISISNNIIDLKYTAVVRDNTVTVAGSYEFKKDLYEASDYLNVKGSFKKIVDKFNEKLVLVKAM